MRASKKPKQRKKKPTVVGSTRKNMIETCELENFGPHKKKPVMMRGTR